MAGSAVNTGYGLINSRSFAKAQFKALHIKQDLFEEYYRDTAAIDKRDMVAFMKASTGYKMKDSIRGCTAKVEVYAGGKETKVVLKSVKAITKALPDCGTHVISGLYHGEFSINHADEYAKRVKAMLE